MSRNTASDNKYEAANSGKYGSMEQQYQQAPTPKSYGGNEEVLSQMLNTLKMEIPKKFLQMGGFGYAQQPSKQSRMQMYMSQMNEQPKQEITEQEPEIFMPPSSKTESLPLVEMAEPEQKEDNPVSSPAIDEVDLGKEQEVGAGESSTKASSQTEKSNPIMMFFGGEGSMTDDKQSNVNGAAKIGLVQRNFYSWLHNHKSMCDIWNNSFVISSLTYLFGILNI